VNVIVVYEGPGHITSSGPPDVDVRITEHEQRKHVVEGRDVTEVIIRWEYA
jgi:hypothetical protein